MIATGGSVVYSARAMEHLKEIGRVVYLQLSCEAVAERLGDLQERGVALKEGQTLRDLYEERTPLYERYADITLNCEGKMIREVVAELAARLDGRYDRVYLYGSKYKDTEWKIYDIM